MDDAFVEERLQSAVIEHVLGHLERSGEALALKLEEEEEEEEGRRTARWRMCRSRSGGKGARPPRPAHDGRPAEGGRAKADTTARTHSSTKGPTPGASSNTGKPWRLSQTPTSSIACSY